MKTKVIVVLVTALVIFVAAYVVNAVIVHARYAITYNLMMRIVVALNREADDLDISQPIVAIKKEFPEIRTRGGSVMDAWGNPLEISISKTSDTMEVRMRSFGNSRRRDDKNDIVVVKKIPLNRTTR